MKIQTYWFARFLVAVAFMLIPTFHAAAQGCPDGLLNSPTMSAALLGGRWDQAYTLLVEAEDCGSAASAVRCVSVAIRRKAGFSVIVTVVPGSRSGTVSRE
jgi:hypothetical protein